jgi:hypothetical protein
MSQVILSFQGPLLGTGTKVRQNSLFRAQKRSNSSTISPSLTMTVVRDEYGTMIPSRGKGKVVPVLN